MEFIYSLAIWQKGLGFIQPNRPLFMAKVANDRASLVLGTAFQFKVVITKINIIYLNLTCTETKCRLCNDVTVVLDY